MSSYRSDRAKRRAARLRNTRIAIIVVLLLMIAGGAYYFLYLSPKSSQNQPAGTGQGMITSPSGLKYEDLIVGNGAEAKTGSTVSVHYTGWLEDGTKFDSSLDRGQPFSFTLGARQVIPGWDEGVAGMKVGGKRKLVIPPDLAYGSQGASGVIPPNATLTFEVQLLSVQ
jgi:FKBP-type peptidyl-prolyl cis-trans isomerase